MDGFWRGIGGLVLVVCGLAWASPAHAHGIWGHVHVTGWAIENLPEGELRDFFDDPEVLGAALFGAAFTDSGYWPQGGELSQRSRAYSEHTHWEPFISDFIAWIVERDPPPWDDIESKKRAAFMMGCAAHGLQDEIFDSLFLFQVHEHDGGGQDEADPGTDGFLALDGHVRFLPEPYIPIGTLLELYQSLDQAVDEDTILDSVSIMESFYLNEVGVDVARALGQQHAEIIPWTRDNYLDPNIPGSLRAEIFPTMHHLLGLWKRLHGDLAGDDVVVFAYPESPRRLLGHESGSPDSWATLIFAAGVRYEDTAPTWVDEAGQAVPFTRQNTRWGGEFPRLLRMTPDASLRPGGWYTIGLPAGPALIDGFEMDTPFSLRFQVACAPENAGDCQDLGDIPVAAIDPPAEPEPEPEPDAGVPDSGTPDAGTPVPPGDADPVESDCACSAARPGGMGLWWLGLAALVWGVRRRRAV